MEGILPRLIENHIYHGMGDVCFQPDAVRIMQRARNIPAVDDGHFQRFFETFLRSIHR
jgi:hypothetical protein